MATPRTWTDYEVALLIEACIWERWAWDGRDVTISRALLDELPRRVACFAGHSACAERVRRRPRLALKTLVRRIAKDERAQAWLRRQLEELDVQEGK